MKRFLFIPMLFLLPALWAQETRSLVVAKIPADYFLLEAKDVPALLDTHNIPFHAIESVNWKADYPYCPEVSFRIAHTGGAILLHYRVKEASVRAEAATDRGRVFQDACVEFFLSPDGNDDYYNFEANCIGRLLIQSGVVNQRRPAPTDEVFAHIKRWGSLGDAPFAEQIGECAWELTLIIPATALYRHSISSFDGKVMRGNFYKCGDKLANPHYLSWSPIDLPRPAFHCPQFFGTLQFE